MGRQINGKIRLGIVGCGGIVTGHHAKCMDSVKDQLVITAVCDVVEERAKDAAELYGASVIVKDYRDMLDDVDAVLIALPHHLHYEAGMFFMENGVHVLMEKPLANTEEQCLKLIEMSKKADVTLMVGYPLRYRPGLLKLKELLDSKVYGDVFQMSIWTEQYTYAPPGNWLGNAEQLGGGQLFSHGCHYVDLLLWYLGQPVKAAHFGTNRGTPWMEKEGTSELIMEFENNVLGYHGGTWGARGSKLGWSIHAQCEKGMLEFINEGEKVRMYYHHDMDTHIPGQGAREEVDLIYEEPSGKQLAYEYEHFIDCILNKKKPNTDAESSLESLRVIWKVYEAEKNNLVADLRDIKAFSPSV